MSALPPSKPPAKPAPLAGGDKGAPASSLPTGAKTLGVSHIKRLQTALGIIDSHSATPTQARSILTGYFRFLNPRMTTEHLPRTLRVHPRDPERGTEGGSKWLVLYFHLGNAARALQDAYRLDAAYAGIPENKTGAKSQAKAEAEAAITLLDARTTRLETLARVGPEEWVIVGDEGEGYALLTQKEFAALPVNVAEDDWKNER